MSQNSIQINSSFRRVLLLVPAMLALLAAIWGFCCFFGNSIAVGAVQSEVAEAAINLAPGDPLAHGKAGFIKSQSFLPDDLPDALKEFETAAALAPHDWRYWFVLCKMYERLGAADKAEAAARRARELAPSYGQVRWLLGNVLLRRGKTDEALVEMRRAAEAEPEYAIHFVNTAVKTLNAADVGALQQTLGQSTAVSEASIVYLLQDNKLDQAIELWNRLPEAQQKNTGATLANVLLNAKRIRAALPIYLRANQLDASSQPAAGRIINPDFETESLDVAAQTNPFFWQIPNGTQPNIGFDDKQKHGGARSLALIFNSATGQEFRQIQQLVPVESNTNYRLETWGKTDNLKTSSTVVWEVSDFADARILAVTPAVPANSSDWQRLAADFKTGAATEAVVVRLTRAVCALPPCPIEGKVWFDDFNLQKTP